MDSPKKLQHRQTCQHGFTLIELMITVAIIGILATLTIPSTMGKHQRADVSQALMMANEARSSITYYYQSSLSFPADNKEAGLPEADMLISNKVTRIEVENGAIHITLGNKVSKLLQGKIFSLRPAVVTGSPNSPISWLCGPAKPVPGMSAIGNNKTNLTAAMIPLSCDY
jgi:type IV pilus assembly protein PilA